MEETEKHKSPAQAKSGKSPSMVAVGGKKLAKYRVVESPAQPKKLKLHIKRNRDIDSFDDPRSSHHAATSSSSSSEEDSSEEPSLRKAPVRAEKPRVRSPRSFESGDSVDGTVNDSDDSDDSDWNVTSSSLGDQSSDDSVVVAGESSDDSDAEGADRKPTWSLLKKGFPSLGLFSKEGTFEGARIRRRIRNKILDRNGRPMELPADVQHFPVEYSPLLKGPLKHLEAILERTHRGTLFAVRPLLSIARIIADIESTLPDVAERLSAHVQDGVKLFADLYNYILCERQEILAKVQRLEVGTAHRRKTSSQSLMTPGFKTRMDQEVARLQRDALIAEAQKKLSMNTMRPRENRGFSGRGTGGNGGGGARAAGSLAMTNAGGQRKFFRDRGAPHAQRRFPGKPRQQQQQPTAATTPASRREQQ